LSDFPPIPLALAHRPTTGGLVIPWVNVQLADGGCDFRTIHRLRWLACWTQGRCQTCGHRVPPGGPVVFFGGPNQLDPDGYFDEPPMHPWCAAYAWKACPMVAGRRSHYATRPRVSEGDRGKVCAREGCDCGGWVPHTKGSGGGEPAHQWWAVYADSWAIATTPDGTVLGGRPEGERRRRLLSTPTVTV
jgi:hypothetical protein